MADVIAGYPDLVSIVLIILAATLSLRLIQRIYYVLRGHVHHYSYHPRQEMLLFLKKNEIDMTEHSFVSKRDKVCLRYRKLGTGQKIVLLNNGVGTDFYMWLPTIRAMVTLAPNLFQEITLIAPSYRGLFASDISTAVDRSAEKELGSEDSSFLATEDSTPDVDIKMSHCVDDALEIMTHAKIKQYHTIIGWSLGAQAALSLCSGTPSATQNLFLLNPSTGTTLHYALQSICPFPLFMRQSVSNAITSLINFLVPIIKTTVWDTLKKITYSTVFRIVLEVSAFLGGFPPEQPVYFHSYMRDVFHTRNQTKGLLRLIEALDAPLDERAFTLPINTVIVSGLPDVITGILHSWRLEQSLPIRKHVTFTMASHFLLLEWPDMLAEEIVNLLKKPLITK